MKSTFAILLFVSLSLAGYGQHLSQLGRYSIPFEKACAPVTISVSFEDNFGNVPRTYIYEEGLIDVTDTFHTYTVPGIYQIVQINGGDIPIKTDTLVFEVVEPRPPEFDVFKCTSNSISVDITDTYYDYYTVMFTPSDSVVVTAADPDPTFTYGGTTASVQVIGRFNNAYPNCADAFQSLTMSDPVDASVISANITEGCQDNFVLNLVTDADPNTRYQLVLQQGSGPFTSVFEGKVSQSQQAYPINFDPATPSYCLRLDKLNACNSTSIPGVESCYTLDIASIRPLSSSYATYTSNDILIALDAGTSTDILVNRRYGNEGSFSFLQSIQASFIDVVNSHYRPYEYNLLQVDTCGNTLDSVKVAAPFLRIQDKNPRTNEIELVVTQPINQLSTFEQSIVIYNSDSSAATELPFENNFTLPARIGDQLFLTVRYYYAAENISIYSNTISTSYETLVYVPGGFTPNGDGLNDHLELFALPPTGEFQLSVYNRWGKLIHQSENENPAWDGETEGELAPEGTYRYKLVFTLPDGKVKSQVGTFVLMK